jgi:hypothetical protein
MGMAKQKIIFRSVKYLEQTNRTKFIVDFSEDYTALK